MSVDFEKLRDMEAYTNALFNRIIALQEKEHAAWQPQAPFEERIHGLPLHALIFSNPDRNPATTGPTVAPFYPLREEMKKIAHYAKQVALEPLVCDFACGNGFVGSLLAREGVRVIGVRDPNAKRNQIADFYDPQCYELRTHPLDQVDFAFDVAFSAWMPAGINLTPTLLASRPKIVVYIYTDHVDASNGRPQTGVPEAFVDLPAGYALIDTWSVTRPADLLHQAWPDLTPNIEETRHVRIYADTPYHGIHARAYAAPAMGYDWEQDLDMATTVLAAKAHLKAKGVPLRFD